MQDEANPTHVQHHGPLEAATHFIHNYFLPILIGAYVLSAVLPQFGLALRDPAGDQLRKRSLARRQSN